MPVVGICESGNWHSMKTAQECAEHSVLPATNMMDMLDGKKRSARKFDDEVEPLSKISYHEKHDPVTLVKVSSQPTIVTPYAPTTTTTMNPNNSSHNNCTIINIISITVSGFASILAVSASINDEKDIKG